MTTEVQIRKSYSHLSQLRTVVSFAAARLGMSRKEIEDTQSAVFEVCQQAIDLAADHQDASLNIKLGVFDDYMTVEIKDPCVPAGSLLTTDSRAFHSGILERVGQFADKVDIKRDEDGLTVLIRKNACRLETAPLSLVSYTSNYGSATLQS